MKILLWEGIFFRFEEEFSEGLTYTGALQQGIIEAVKPPADEI